MHRLSASPQLQSPTGGEGSSTQNDAPPNNGLPSTKEAFRYHAAIEAALSQQLLDTQYAHKQDMHDFFSMLGTPVEGNLVQECMKQLREKDQRVDKGGLTKKRKGVKENALYAPLREVLNTICSEFNKSRPAEDAGGFVGTAHPRAYQLEYHVWDTTKTKLRDCPSMVQHPDLCLVVGPKKGPSKEGREVPPSWHDVILPIEIKNTPMDVDLQSAMQAMALHTVQDSRIFSYSMTIGYPMCQAHLWDRSGHISSPSFDITEEEGLKELIILMGRFSTMTLKDHGFDPTAFSVQDGKPQPPLQLPLYIRHKQNDLYQLDKRITPSSDLFGKETRFWGCSLPDSGGPDPTDPSIIKENWLHDERTDSEPPGQRLPSDVPGQDFTLFAKPDDDEWSEAVDEVEMGTLTEDVSFADGYEAGIYSYLQQVRIRGLAKFHGPEKLESTFCDIRKSFGGNEHLSRTRHRVLLGTVSKPLRETLSPAVLLQAIRDIVDGLCRRGILQRDVSDTNCLMDSTTLQGFLADLDHAISVNRL